MYHYDILVFFPFQMSQTRNFTTSASADVSEGILLGLGNPLLDISIVGTPELLAKYNLEANNAIIADSTHKELFEEMVKDFHPEYLPGGATQNSIRVAQWMLQRQKATSIYGGIGDDIFGTILRQKVVDVGVDVCYEVHPSKETGICGAIITGEDRSLVTKLGAAELFSVKFLEEPENWKHVERAQYFYIGGFFIPVSPEAVLKVLKHAAENNKTIIMNLHALFLCKHFADPDLNLMAYVDILFGNGDEAAEYSSHQGFNTKDVMQMALKTSKLPKINSSRERVVVFTQGKQPTILAHNGQISENPISAIDKSQIKDTNGCGDAFVGGFLSQLVQGRSISECMKGGFYAAKVVIQHFGCMYPEKPDFQ